MRFTPLLLLIPLLAAAQPAADPFARLKCGDLNHAEQRAYEDRLAADPNDPNARSCLLVQAQLQKDWPNVARHTEWAIDNFARLPEAPGLIRSAGSIRTADPALYAGVERKLIEAAKKSDISMPGLLTAAASLIAETDLALAVELLENAYGANKSDPALSARLGQIYARDVLRGGANSMAILRSSRDAFLLRSAVSTLRSGNDAAYRSLAAELLQRAAEIQPLRPFPAEAPRVSAEASLANRVKYVAPVYPAEALEAGLEGLVKFDAVIDREGRIRPINVLAGASVFIAPARNAALQWEYRPFLLNGLTAEVVTTIEVRFTLPQ